MGKQYNIDELVSQFNMRDKYALAKLVTQVENNPNLTKVIFNRIRKLSSGTKKDAHIVGLTGSPGVGKSSLVNAILKDLLDRGLYVGVISVDPSSPFSGGAFLGDRVRMSDVAMHPNVFIRSLASRGYKGGISRAVFDISLLYEAFGMDVILIETVGVGQSEFEIYKLVHSTCVILVPGYGDGVQMQKAGTMEIGDLYIVNKKDLGGKDIVVQLEMMLDDSPRKLDWRPPALQTNALTGEGIKELVDKIFLHKQYLLDSSKIDDKTKTRYKYKIQDLLNYELQSLIKEKMMTEEDLEAILDQFLDKKFVVYDVVEEMMGRISIKNICRDDTVSAMMRYYERN